MSKDYKDRLKEEVEELFDKKKKLENFIIYDSDGKYKKLPEYEKSLISFQLQAMTLYYNVLRERLRLFG